MKGAGRIADVLIAAGLLAVIVAAPTQAGFEVRPRTYLSLVDPLLWGVFLLWVLRAVPAGKQRCVRLPGPAAFLFVAAAALSVLRAGNRFAVLKDVFQYVEYFLVAVAVFGSTANTTARMKRFVGVFVAAGCVVLAAALVQYAMPSVETFRVRGTFGNRNVLGGYLSLLLPLVYGLALCARGRLWRAGGLLLIAGGLLVTLAGGALLGLGTAFAVQSAAAGRRACLVFALVMVAAVVFVLPVLPRQNADVLLDSVSLFDADAKLSTRYPEWQAAAEMTRENPLLGVGAGNYQENIGSYYGTIPRPPGTAEPDSQNLYLVLASSLGIPGLAAFLAMLLLAVRGSAGAFAGCGDPFRRGLALGLCGSFAAYAVNSVWSPLLVRGVGMPLAILLGFATALTRLPASGNVSGQCPGS